MSLGRKVLAIALCALLVTTAIPGGVVYRHAYAASGTHVDVFTVTVTDSSTNPIEGARIEFIGGALDTVTVTTGDDGVAEVPEITGLSDTSASDTLTYTITATGYNDTSGSLTVDSVSDNYQDDIPVILTGLSTVAVTGTLTDSATSYPIAGVSVSLSGYAAFGPVETGSDGTYTIPDVYDGKAYDILFLHQKYNPTLKSLDLTQDNPTGVDEALTKETVLPKIDTLNVEPAVWTNQNVTISGSVSDIGSGVAGVYYKRADEFSYSPADLDNGSYTITINAQNYEGGYDIYCEDNNGNESVHETASVKMDIEKPTITLDPYNSGWTKEDVTISGIVSDGLSGIAAVYYKKSADVNYSLASDLNISTGIYSILIAAQSYEGSYDIYCEDNAGNKSDLSVVGVRMNNKKPSISATASTYEWTNGPITISGTASSALSDIAIYIRKGTGAPGEIESTQIDSQNWSYSYTISPQNYDGNYTVYCIDEADNQSDDQVVAVRMDNTTPVAAQPSPSIDTWTNSAVTISGTVSDGFGEIDKIYYKQGSSGITGEITNVSNGNYTFEISAQNYRGDYYVYCVDKAGNISDDSLPVAVSIDNEKCFVLSAIAVLPDGTELSDWTAQDVTINGSIEDNLSNVDRIFIKRADSGTPVEITDKSETLPLKWTFSYLVTAQDYEGDYIIYGMDKAGNIAIDYSVPVEMDVTAPVIDAATADITTWTNTDVVISGTVSDNLSGVAEVFYKKGSSGEPVPITDVSNGNFTFTVDKQDYEGDYVIYALDVAGNRSVDEPVSVKMDITAPTNLTISYSTPLLAQVIGLITFGYYSPSVTVTVTADDASSGVDHFNWKYTQEPGTSVAKNVPEEGAQINTGDITYSHSGMTATASFTLTGDAAKQYRGSIKFTATDKAGNTSDEMDDAANEVVVVDTISPTRTVTYSAPRQIVNKSDLKTSTVDVDQENTSSIFYYDSDVTATIKVIEANFYEEDVVIKVNGVAQSVSWTKNADEHAATVTLSGNGDYIITINYTDRSANKMVDYQSEQITIDTIAPKVAVSYTPAEEIRTLGGRAYYDAPQTATITVTEHNFRADDIVASITAKNVMSKDVSAALVSDLTAHLSDRGSWTKIGDNYTTTITYPDDANYTFDIDYRDLALRQIADYTEDMFTVDTTAPTNLTVSYSTNLFETILESVTFGYYNAKMTVTITADDITAGIYRFQYSYLKSAGISSVNAELIDQAITNAEVTYSNDGLTATARFEIPKLVLAGDNQFNGTVEFTAYDRSENNAERADTHRVVVDNIAPTASIAYNAPVQSANNISYYAGEVNATINITEANFFSQDVNVSVTRNGGAFPVSVNWSDRNVDEHIGTFTLTGDGDYIVSVTYRDRSNNQMTEYTSNQLTIDTTRPAIRVDGIGSESANNDVGDIGFTIAASDINFDASRFDPVLTAVVKDGSGFKTITIANPVVTIITVGQEYAYTFENLDTDGIYFLRCSTTDMSGNTFSDIVVTDSSNATMQTVVFSVNREGSTFMLDDNATELVGTYYVQNVYDDVVIIETNADPLRSYKVTVDGTDKTEGVDYTVTQTGGGDSWNKYTYVIAKELFEAEGEYRVVVSSKDKAENDAYSDIKSAEVNFVVDRTAPVLTISGLQENGRYQVETQTVTVIPKDDGGKLNSIKVIVKDNSGNEIVVPLEKSGEDFLNALEENGGKLTFEIPSGYNQSVQIFCTDLAQDNRGDTNFYDNTFGRVTVSTNFLVIFFANTPLFFGTIGGVILVAGLISFFFIFKRRRRDNNK
jgi:hypothetical protein